MGPIVPPYIRFRLCDAAMARRNAVYKPL